MNHPSRRSPRAPRAAAVAVAGVLATAWFAPPSAWAAGSAGPTTTAPTQASLQTQAQEIAAQIQADGRELDKMAEAYNAAQIRSSQLASQVASLEQQSLRTAAQADSARRALKEQVVLSYVIGGAPMVGSVPGSVGGTRNLALSYAEIVSGGQKRALDAYRQLMAAQASQARQLTADQHEAEVTLAAIASDRQAAAQADTARRAALAQVNGQLAVLVAQVQAEQQAAAKAAALAAEQRRSSAPPTTAPRPGTRPPFTQPPSSPSTTAPQSRSTVPSSTTPPTGSTGGATSGSPPPPGSGGSYAQAPGANKAIAYAYEQLGKPYQWAGAGPNSFDCSGLTMMAWDQAGIYFPHLAQDQYNLTKAVPLSSAIPGDLIFFGTPSNVYHVGLYIGNGQMIDAPQTGENVSIQSIYWSDLLGAGRVTTSS